MSTTKTAPLGFRVGPKLAYILKLAAKEKGMSVSAFVDQTLSAALLEPREEPSYDPERKPLPTTLVISPWASLWDEDPAVRLLLLASSRPDLLTGDERRLFTLLTSSLKQGFRPSYFVEAYNDASVDKTHLEREA